MQKKLVCSALVLALAGLSGCKRNQKLTQYTKTSDQQVTMPFKGDNKNTKVSFFNEDAQNFDDIDTFALDEDSLNTDGKTLAFNDTPGLETETKTVLFDYDSASPRKDQVSALNAVQESINDWVAKGYKVVFKGHSCRWHGTRAYNIALSQQRAQSLADMCNVAKENLSVFGVGNEEPIAFDNSKDGQAPNRRVDVYPLTA